MRLATKGGDAGVQISRAIPFEMARGGTNEDNASDPVGYSILSKLATGADAPLGKARVASGWYNK